MRHVEAKFPAMGNFGDRLDECIISNNPTHWPSGYGSVASDKQIHLWTTGPWMVGYLWLFCICISVLGTFFRLHERLASLMALTPGLFLWCASTSCVWFSANDPRLLLLANATWLAGSGFILFTMMLAVRSSLREIDGLCKQKKARTPKSKRRLVNSAAVSSSTDDSQPTPTTAIDFEEIPSQASAHQQPVHNDNEIDQGNETAHQQRRLSKAERRRLRKLARNGRAAHGPLTKCSRSPIVSAEVTRDSSNSFCTKPHSAFFTSAVFAPHYSTGCLHNATAASLFCGSMTPMKSVIWKMLWNQFSRALSGSGLRGMRAQEFEAITVHIFSPNVPTGMRRRLHNFLTKALPIGTLRPRRNLMQNAKKRKPRVVRSCTAEDSLL